jgi:hypothetical protein
MCEEDSKSVNMKQASLGEVSAAGKEQNRDGDGMWKRRRIDEGDMEVGKEYDGQFRNNTTNAEANVGQEIVKTFEFRLRTHLSTSFNPSLSVDVPTTATAALLLVPFVVLFPSTTSVSPPSAPPQSTHGTPPAGSTFPSIPSSQLPITLLHPLPMFGSVLVSSSAPSATASSTFRPFTPAFTSRPFLVSQDGPGDSRSVCGENVGCGSRGKASASQLYPVLRLRGGSSRGKGKNAHLENRRDRELVKKNAGKGAGDGKGNGAESGRGRDKTEVEETNEGEREGVGSGGKKYG